MMEYLNFKINEGIEDNQGLWTTETYFLLQGPEFTSPKYKFCFH